MHSRLFHTAPIRLTIIFVLIFSLAAALLGGIILLSVRHSLTQQLYHHVENERHDLMIDYQQDGLDELLHDIRERRDQKTTSRLLYAVRSEQGKQIFDSIPFPETNGWHEPPDIQVPILLNVTPLGDGYRLAIAASLDPVLKTEQAIRHSFGGAIAAILLVGLIGGGWVSRSFLGHIGQLTQAAERIGQEDLHERLPVRHTGDSLDRLAQTMNRMLNRIQRLIRNQEQVSTNIAHDLRTPLGQLRPLLEQLHQPMPHADQQMLASRALQQLDHVLSLFTALLRLAEIESGSRRAGFTRVNLTALLTSLHETYAPVAEETGHRLTATLFPALECEGDPHLLTQLFVNLIENALRHTPPGTALELRLIRHGSHWQAEVADHGPGIPANERSQVIQPFYRLDASRHTEGSGLGLSLTAAIAALHGLHFRLEDNFPGVRAVVSKPPKPQR